MSAKGHDAGLVSSWEARSVVVTSSVAFAPLARHYTMLAEEIRGQLGLGVRVASLGSSAPPAITDRQTNTIVLNGDLLGDLDELSQSDLTARTRVAVVEGVLRREIGRLAHSRLRSSDGSLGLAAAMCLLEEIRIEARAIADHPGSARWMRAAASVITVSSLDLTQFNASFRTISAATLTLGRIHAGTLRADDVSDLAELFRAALGDEVFDALDVLFAEVVRIDDDDLVSLERAARRLLDLVGSADGTTAAALSDARTAAEQTLRAVSQNATSSPGLTEPRRPPRTTPNRYSVSTSGERREDAQIVDAPTTGAETAQRPGIDTRPPTETEYVLRTHITRLFRHARFREREFSDELRSTPPGRVRVSGLVQRDAAFSEGALNSLAPVFQRRLHRHVDEPILAVGIAVDTSGSMSGKERPLATALFALSSAVENAGGLVAISAFGEAFVPIANPAAPLRGVPMLRSGGGTAHVAAAVDFVARAAMLDRPRHYRQLYILSDGQWRDKEEVERRLARLRDAGCSVLIVDFGSSFQAMQSSDHLELTDVHELADALAKRFEDAYQRRA